MSMYNVVSETFGHKITFQDRQCTAKTEPTDQSDSSAPAAELGTSVFGAAVESSPSPFPAGFSLIPALVSELSKLSAPGTSAWHGKHNA